MSYSSRSRPRCCIIQQKNTDGEDCRQYKDLLLKPKSVKQKSPDDCFNSFIDQEHDSSYSPSKLVRSEPRSTKDIYDILKSNYTSQVKIVSFKRNYSHKCIALFKKKNAGPVRDNIDYVLGSFLELDGSTDGTTKTRNDVFAYCKLCNLPKPTYVIETSLGHFHVLWIYNNHLPWTEKNESYWMGQQKRLIELFKLGCFLVDEGASLNPVQNLRNPSQLEPYNYKRKCQVVIEKTFNKTSLRAIYRALNGTNIPNPKRVQARIKLRRYLRQNKHCPFTYDEWAEVLCVSRRTAVNVVQQAVANGDLSEPKMTGNNKGEKRRTHYTSLIFIEPEQPFSGVQTSICKTNYSANEWLYSDFCKNGAEKGYRNKTLFTLGVHLKLKKNGNISLEELKNALEQGRCKSCTPEKEFEQTLKNALKSKYIQRLSVAKLDKWGLLGTERNWETASEQGCSNRYQVSPIIYETIKLADSKYKNKKQQQKKLTPSFDEGVTSSKGVHIPPHEMSTKENSEKVVLANEVLVKAIGNGNRAVSANPFKFEKQKEEKNLIKKLGVNPKTMPNDSSHISELGPISKEKADGQLEFMRKMNLRDKPELYESE
ncbi:MAG: hypothetical protein IH875_09720 [Candidatus Dadabacteria bacterium]|nr:hypothetical protein [Candidatus Dadabacteria bacterium]